ncbi:MAG: hypothetical protein JSW03_04260 [Candidatus Eiseniibacteriota bacterium]|nr:MAG: hypothetical protein JSW03_04260 [Candidatus Eisenbacteria bacterium]
MPITYNVYRDGRFIHAVAKGPLTSDEFVQYELDHATDKRIKSPLAELLEIEPGACKDITMEDMNRVLEQRSRIKRSPARHRCAIVVSPTDTRCWDLAKFYEAMVPLHNPETTIVFGDAEVARVWLGVDEESYHHTE